MSEFVLLRNGVLFLFLLASEGIFAAAKPVATMHLQITHIAVSQGIIRIAVYQVDDGKRWQEKAYRFAEFKKPRASKVAKVHLKDMPEGNYAIKLYHDENDNGQLDFKDSGYPDEPFAFSQDAKQKKRVLTIKDAIIPFNSSGSPIILELRK